MKKYYLLLLLILTGCTSAHVELINSVNTNYETIIFDDKVDLKEAKLIAQKELINQNLVLFYDLSNPQEQTKNIPKLPQSKNYWFIVFKEIEIDTIPFIFTAIIHRETGDVLFANDYAKGRDWILEAALLKN